MTRVAILPLVLAALALAPATQSGDGTDWRTLHRSLHLPAPGADGE